MLYLFCQRPNVIIYREFFNQIGYFWRMIKENYNVIGVMSGTSLDGIDLAHIHFHLQDGKWSFTILESETLPYPAEWLTKLREAIHFTAPSLETLNEAYTFYLGGIIKSFVRKHEISGLDAVCSHGHTILHDPGKGYTLQIGNLPAIADITGETVVCDFRVQDVALGGQGAPLVPIGDRLLFGSFDYCLNLGGFSNISFEEEQQRIAFDISPVNTVLNFFANRLGLDYDDHGKIAASGTINKELLAALNNLPYYSEPYPKSLGVEFVNEEVLPLIARFELDDKDILATFSEHVAMQIGKVLHRKDGTVLITGGGAYHKHLISRLHIHSHGMKTIIPGETVLEFKEALIFALLGVLKLRHENNVLASVTGAQHDHSSGIIYHPK